MAEPLASSGRRALDSPPRRGCACGGGCPECSAAPTRRSLGPLAPPRPLQHASGEGRDDAFLSDLKSLVGPAVRPAAERETLPKLWGRLGPGEAIAREQREPFEASYGYDFSPVRLHRGPMADRLTGLLGVSALSAGGSIVLSNAVGDVGAGWGHHVLGHELAHVGQRAGRSPSGSLRSRRLDGVSITDRRGRAEIEAADAVRAALAGNRYALGAPLDEDLATFPWLLLGAALLITGAVVIAAPDIEENAARAEEDPDMLINTGWVYVPGAGSLIQVWQARSGLERGVGAVFLALDIVTLGMAGAALLKLSQAGIQSLRGAGSAATRELTEAGMRSIERETAEQLVQTELRAGRAIVGAEGGLNHSVIYVMNESGDIVRLHGGVSRLLYPADEIAEESFRMGLNAFTVVEDAGANLTLLRAAESLRDGGALMMRSCSATQCVLLERAAISGASQYVPRSYAGRFIPATVIGHQALQGTVHVVNLPRLITGTVVHEGLVLGVPTTIHAAGTVSVVVPATPGAPIPGTSLVPNPVREPAVWTPEPEAAPTEPLLDPQLLSRAQMIVDEWGTQPESPVLEAMLDGIGSYFAPYNTEDPQILTTIYEALLAVGMANEPANLIVRRLYGVPGP